MHRKCCFCFSMSMIHEKQRNKIHSIKNALKNIHTLKGSKGSGSGGLESVFTAQNIHPLVHVSPKSIIVPVPPFQHSPILGHCASSHTVFNDRSDKDSLTFWYRDFSSAEGAGTWNHDGRPFGMGAPTLGLTSPSSSSSTKSCFCSLVDFFLGMATPPPPEEPSPRETTYDSDSAEVCFDSSTVENNADENNLLE